MIVIGTITIGTVVSTVSNSIRMCLLLLWFLCIVVARCGVRIDNNNSCLFFGFGICFFGLIITLLCL